MEKDTIIKKVKAKESRNGKYRDYRAESNHEQQYYLELTKKSPAFKACSPRQRFFVINYVLCGGNASKAMVLSGTTSRYYAQTAAKWMKEDRIQNAIHEFWEIVFGDKINKIERNLIDALYRRAFTNRWDYFNKDGSLKEGIKFPHDLGEDHVIIDGIEKKYYGKDADVEVVVYKLADRDTAFRQLQSMLGLDNKNINLRSNRQDKSTGVLVTPGIIEADDWEKMNE
jgi:hypothetical protein